MFDIPNSFTQYYDADNTISDVISGPDANADKDKAIYDLFYQSVDELKDIRRQYISIFAYSAGKDSTVTLLAGLEAHKQLMISGELDSDDPFVVSNIDTGVENPFITSLVYYERDRLQEHCKVHDIKLEFLIYNPPVNKQWTSLFASGHKLLSTARLNNDCSHILKIDSSIHLARHIKEKFGQHTCNILGTYIAESAKRGATIRKHGNDKATPQSVPRHGGGRGFTYLPIKHWNVDLVWDCLRRAGDDSEAPTTFPIPSYAPNHRLLRLIYGNAEDRGACPITADRVRAGNTTTNSVGGCGKSRFGCYVCLKSTKDKSGENLSKLPRYATIAGNALKFRNWLSSIAHDVRFRTYHARAVEPVTGAITLQPNVLKSSILEKIIWYAAMLTYDDIKRAKQFNKLLEAGTPELDAGYKDILDDKALSDDDRVSYLTFYCSMATQNVINMFTLDHALIISAIHARDGIRLPPYRALWIYDQVFCQEKRIPYPAVELSYTHNDEIGDARMILPEQRHLMERVNSGYDLTMQLEEFEDCTWSNNDASIKVTTQYGNEFHRYKQLVAMTDKIRQTPLAKAVNNQFTIRKSKLKRKQGRVVGAIRGRTSVNWYRPRDKSRYEQANLLAQTDWVPSHQQFKTPITQVHVDTSLDGYVVNYEAMDDWILVESYQRCLTKHDNYVEAMRRKKGSRYQFFTTEPFEHFRLNGVISFSPVAQKNSQVILNRTKHFLNNGLYDVPDNHTIMSHGLSMAEFRTYLASALVNVRNERNLARSRTKAMVLAAHSDPLASELNRLEKDFSIHMSYIISSIWQEIGTQAACMVGFQCFDGICMQSFGKVNNEYQKQFKARFLDIDGVINQLQSHVRSSVKQSAFSRALVAKVVDSFNNQFHQCTTAIFNEVIVNIQTSTEINVNNLWLTMFCPKLENPSELISRVKSRIVAPNQTVKSSLISTTGNNILDLL